MNNLQIFENKEFGAIRTLQVNNKIYFVGKDVAEILGYERPTKAVTDHVDIEDRDAVPIQDSIGRMQNTPVINESGLYSLILSSKLPTAKRFKRWVTSEVLPAIRKHGVYAVDDLLNNPDALITALTAYKEEKEKNKILQEDNDRMKPKEVFADAVATSETSILIGDLAKILKQNGIQTGQKRLFEWLRQNGYLMNCGASRNLPTQRAMELKLFEVKETAINNPDGSVRITRTTKVTGKGQQYIINKFLGA